MTTMDFSEAEVALLAMLVKWRLSGLQFELDHTDSREYRDMLRTQRTDLERLQQKLGG
jgi:hypothetical protein